LIDFREDLMTKKTIIAFAAVALFMFIGAAPSFGQWFVDFENGLAVSGYNDVRIPGNTGTLFSLSEELTTDPGYYFRVRLGYRWKSRHTISVFAAPGCAGGVATRTEASTELRLPR
jgi:hypothetical protein